MRVLIIGAGVAGLSCAVAMRRAGVEELTILERAPAVGAHRGTGVAIPPNGARAIKQMGLDVDRLIAQGSRLREYQFRTPSGRIVTRADLTRLWLSDGEPYFAVHRHHLYDQMLVALEGQRIEFETTWELVPADTGAAAGAHVRARITGPGGAARDQEFDLVVGADGIRSAVRRTLWPDVAPRRLGWATWRTVIEYGGAPAETQVVYSGRGGVFLFIPLSGGVVYIYAAVRRGEDAAPSAGGHGAELVRLFGDFDVDRAIFDALHKAPDASFHVGALEEVPYEQLHACGRGRVMVLGDALHACSPSMAQGVSLAAEDACVLAELASAASDVSSAAIADSFWRRRLPRIRHVQECTRKRDHLVNRRADSALFARVSNVVMKLRGGDSLQREAFGFLLENPL